MVVETTEVSGKQPTGVLDGRRHRGRRPLELRVRLGQPQPGAGATGPVLCPRWTDRPVPAVSDGPWQGCPWAAGASVRAGGDVVPPADDPGPTTVETSTWSACRRSPEDDVPLALPLPPPWGARTADLYIWQVDVLVRAQLVRVRWQTVAVRAGRAQTEVVARLLSEAEAACAVRRGCWRHRHGGPVEAAWTSVHAAEALLVAAGGPSLEPPDPGAPDEPAAVAAARLQRQHRESAWRHVALRSFRGTVLGAAAAAALVVAGLVVLGALAPATLPLCATATPSADRACLLGGVPGASDVLVMAAVGAAAGALSGVLTLRDLDGSATPFAVPTALAVLKVPVGALAAVLGLLLLVALAPGTVGLSSASGLLAWAVVLGASQQLVTRLADAQGRALLAKI